MKRKLVKRWMCLVLSAAMAIMAVGCGDTANSDSKSAQESGTEKSTDDGTDDGGTPEGGKVTLNVWHQWSNDTNELKKKYDEAVASYMEENKNVEINTQALDTEAYKTKISAEFAGEAKGIDVFYYWGAGMAKKLVSADKLLPLDDYLTDEVKGNLVEGSK